MIKLIPHNCIPEQNSRYMEIQKYPTPQKGKILNVWHPAKITMHAKQQKNTTHSKETV